MSVIVCWNCKTRYRRWKTGNIRVDGVTEEKGEMWEDSEKKVLEILRDKLEIEDVTRERAHRVKLYQNKKNNKGEASTRTTICKLLNDKDKTQILKKCKKSLREEDKIAYLNYKTIIWREKNEI